MRRMKIYTVIIALHRNLSLFGYVHLRFRLLCPVENLANRFWPGCGILNKYRRNNLICLDL